MARKNQYPAKIITETEASCGKCNTMKPHSEFTKDKSAPMGLGYWCKVCASENSRKNYAKRIANGDLTFKQQKRSAYFVNKYGLTLEEYHKKLNDQGNSCAICGVGLLDSGHLTHLDHCHTTGKLRAFLCTNCNRGLGHFKDNKEFLMKAIRYLDTHTVNGSQKEGRSL